MLKFASESDDTDDVIDSSQLVQLDVSLNRLITVETHQTENLTRLRVLNASLNCITRSDRLKTIGRNKISVRSHHRPCYRNCIIFTSLLGPIVALCIVATDTHF